ncbi:MAG TPA: hypothetical protein VGP22_06810 [Albitalea sp.]|nr:hypothetical protein [Albitalea sp.]
MTLSQYHALKIWHTRHSREHPVEKSTWDAVLTLWMLGCVGGPASLLLGSGWGALLCLGLIFLPGAYVGCRLRLHRIGRLRCDWITALR